MPTTGNPVLKFRAEPDLAAKIEAAAKAASQDVSAWLREAALKALEPPEATPKRAPRPPEPAERSDIPKHLRQNPNARLVTDLRRSEVKPSFGGGK